MTEGVLIDLLALVNKELEREYKEGLCRYDVHYIMDLINAKKQLLIEFSGENEINEEIIRNDNKKYIEQLEY